MLSVNTLVVSAIALAGLAPASNEGQGGQYIASPDAVVSFSRKDRILIAAENDGNAAFLPSSVLDQANCNESIEASSTHSFPLSSRVATLPSDPGSNGEAIESVLAGMHESDDAPRPSGDAILYLTHDAFAKFVGGGVPRSPRDVEVVWDYG